MFRVEQIFMRRVINNVNMPPRFVAKEFKPFSVPLKWLGVGQKLHPLFEVVVDSDAENHELAIIEVFLSDLP